MSTRDWFARYRTFPNKYAFSHVLCWVAASRGARLTRRLGRESLAAEWAAWADGYREIILDQAYNKELGFFTQVLSEDIEPRTGLLLGNFPQAYTHVGLINTAVTISELIEARDSRFRAWS